MSAPTLPPPGWYRDPYAPAGLRWWDGLSWSRETRPQPGQPQPGQPQPGQALPGQQFRPAPVYAGRNERIGRWAMLTWAPILVLYSALAARAFSSFFRTFLDYVDEVGRAIEENRPEPPPPPFSDGQIAGMLLSSVGALLLWIPLALLITWTYRSAVTAAALRLPAEHDPAWAIAGWIVPVISLWFPYQSIRDCLPPDDEARRDVGYWWAGYLTCSILGPGLFLVALIGPIAYLVGLLVLAALATGTVVVGLRVVKAVDEAHRKLLPDA